MEIDELDGGDKKKRKNSGSKGRRTELNLTKVLNQRFGEGSFTRTIGSGNRWGQVTLRHQHAIDTLTGDLVCPPGFKFVFESKGGYDIDFNTVFEGGSRILDSFIEQSTRDAKDAGRMSLIAWKKDRRPWLVILRTENLFKSNWDYRFIYKDWSIVALSEFLTADDSYFLNSPN